MSFLSDDVVDRGEELRGSLGRQFPNLATQVNKAEMEALPKASRPRQCLVLIKVIDFYLDNL